MVAMIRLLHLPDILTQDTNIRNPMKTETEKPYECRTDEYFWQKIETN